MEHQRLETEIIDVDLDEISNLAKNARFMSGQQLRQLASNIKRDGALTSLPLLYKPDKVANPDFFEQSGGRPIIISGNHRVMAAREAGLRSCKAILITTQVSDSRLRAIQLSHNAISGQDDISILTQLYESLDLDEKLYSGLTDDDFDIEKVDVSGLGLGAIEYVEIVLAFLPQEIKPVEGWLKSIEDSGRKSETLVARYADFDEFIHTMSRVKLECKVTNSALAFSQMCMLANERIDQIVGERDNELAPNIMRSPTSGDRDEPVALQRESVSRDLGQEADGRTEL